MGWFRRFSEGRRVFVETGTFRGDGIERALKDFDSIYSVEMDWEFFISAKRRFAGNPKVTVLLGDSGDVLQDLFIPEPCVFYLDAHWSGWGEETELPLLRELEAIARRPKGDVVVIDDMRLMGKVSLSGGEGDWPLAEFDFSQATLERITEICPGRQEMADDIDRLIIYRE